MKEIKSIAVFCASAKGENPIYVEKAYQVGQFLAQRGIRIIYGGASIGCMGAVAEGALAENGSVVGILPHFLDKREIAHLQLEELIRVESMHERKLLMNEMSDATLTLPGGFGTMEELFELITWAQLGLHEKPNAILNVNSYYDHLIKQIEVMCREKLLKEKHRKMLLISDDIGDLWKQIINYQAPETEQWLIDGKE